MIRFTDVHKGFSSQQVLNGVNLEAATGKSLVIIGGSGTGKSVLLKCVLGMLRPEEGAIEIDGQDVLQLKKADHAKAIAKIGMLFQGGALFDSLPVWHNIAFGLLARRQITRRQARDIAVERLADVGLASAVADAWPAALSGGMQKRVALARAIAFQPSIMFFDEPTTGLDPINGDVINELIAKCVHELGATAISITHDMASVRKIADSVAMLYGGKVIWQGKSDDLDHTDNPFVHQFVTGSATGPITDSP